MANNKFIRKFLKLQHLSIVDYWFSSRPKTLNLLVKPYKNGARCPKCSRRGKILRTLDEPRCWSDLTVCEWSICLRYCPREILCPIHGRVQEQIPWADAYARITYRLEYVMLVYSQQMTQKAAAALLRIPQSTFSELLHRSITRLRAGHRIRGLKSIGIDEISYAKRRKYATIVYDLDRSCVVWVGRGKGRQTIDIFFKTQLSPYQKRQIKWASCDMSQAYMGAIRDHCPNATLVLDRFHIVKALNAAVDELRKEQWRKASPNRRKALKGLRWLLFRHSTKRTKEDTELLKSLNKGNRRIYRASVLKDEFEKFWDYQDPAAAEAFLKGWMTAALKSRLKPIKKFVRTLQKHYDHIIPFIQSRLTNAVAEGLNRKIKIIKNRASGYRTLEAFSDLIYLTVGNVNLPDQIPAKFRTL